MPAIFATFLYVSFILYLFISDYRNGRKASKPLWIPLIWMLIVASKPVSFWLDGGVNYQTLNDYLEGSPLDRNVFLILILAALGILVRRQISWRELASRNAVLVLFVMYCGLSVLWSDYPELSFKRWVKQIGSVLMVLVVLSDPEPERAVTALFKRVAYVLVPLSVLFIKYYPDIGRGQTLYI